MNASPPVPATVKPGRPAWVSRVGAYTFKRHLPYSALEGVWQGVMQTWLLSLIVMNTFHLDTAEQKLASTLIAGLPSVAMLTAPMWDRAWLRGRRYWLFMAWVGRFAPAIMLALAGSWWAVVAAIVASGVASSGQSPTQNALFARNYNDEERERFHGLARMAHIPMLVGSALVLAALMDWNSSSWRWGILVAAILSAIGTSLMHRVRLRRLRLQKHSMRSMPVMAASGILGYAPLSWARMGAMGFFAPYKRTFQLLMRNRDFAIYETGFMLYGINFMMLMPVVPVFYKQLFKIDYTEFTIHTMVTFHAVMFIGHFLLRGRTGSWSAAKVAGVAFTILFGYPLFLLAAAVTHNEWFGVGGFIMFGIAMVFVDYAWNYGPERFSRGRDASPYVMAHAMLVGVRAAIAFPASYLVMSLEERGDFTLSLLIPVGLLCGAVSCCLWLAARQRRAAREAAIASQATD